MSALQQVGALAPDALLLDIQMPGASGLDVAASLPEPAPAVVFVTAYDRYAVQAFDAAAIDYLLKPVEPERLARALARLRARRHGGTRPLPPRQLLVPDWGRTHVIQVDQIEWLEAADNYVIIHAADRAPLMRRALEIAGRPCASLGSSQGAPVSPQDRGPALHPLFSLIAHPCSRRISWPAQ